jgi:uncharacterized protein YjhX (UPF0386 family)
MWVANGMDGWEDNQTGMSWKLWNNKKRSMGNHDKGEWLQNTKLITVFLRLKMFSVVDMKFGEPVRVNQTGLRMNENRSNCVSI